MENQSENTTVAIKAEGGGADKSEKKTRRKPIRRPSAHRLFRLPKGGITPDMEARIRPQDELLANHAVVSYALGETLAELGQRAGIPMSKNPNHYPQKVRRRLQALGVRLAIAEKLRKMDVVNREDVVAQLTRFAFDSDDILLDPRHREIARKALVDLAKIGSFYQDTSAQLNQTINVIELAGLSPAQLRRMADDIKTVLSGADASTAPAGEKEERQHDGDDDDENEAD